MEVIEDIYFYPFQPQLQLNRCELWQRECVCVRERGREKERERVGMCLVWIRRLNCRLMEIWGEKETKYEREAEKKTEWEREKKNCVTNSQKESKRFHKVLTVNEIVFLRERSSGIKKERERERERERYSWNTSIGIRKEQESSHFMKQGYNNRGRV